MSDPFVEQLTKEQAIAMYDGGEWKTWDAEQIVKFQLFQDKLCVPFDKFHEAIEKVLGRPVWTHEFAFHDLLVREYLGIRPAPTMQEIIDLIPAEKRIVIQLGGEDASQD